MNRVYSAVFGMIVLPFPALAVPVTFELYSPGRQLSIQSVNWDFKIVDQATGMILPFENNQVINPEFSIITPAGNMAYTFDNFVGVGIGFAQGSMMFYRPFKQRFDSFFISERANLQVVFINNDALNTYVIYNSIIIEVQEKIIYR